MTDNEKAGSEEPRDVVDGAAIGGDVGGGGVTVGDDSQKSMTISDLLDENERDTGPQEDASDQNPDNGSGRKVTPGD